MTTRDAAWDRVFESLPVRWRIGRGRYDHGSATYSVSAIGPHPGRGGSAQVVTGIGHDETSALLDLDAQLRRVPGGQAPCDELWVEARLAYYFTAEKWSLATTGRALTQDELEAVLERYSGR